MATASAARSPEESEYDGILARAARAVELARTAAGNVSDVIAFREESAYERVRKAEEELDQIDRAVDVTVASAVTHATLEQSRELLACMKMVIDLERVGDLVASVASCAHALGARIPMDDVADLVTMSCILEKMLTDATQAFSLRDNQLAMQVLKTDSELDRRRNLLIIRHLEQAETRITSDSVQILFMAQALERAGDHVKNLAEEVCHLVSGQSIRHLVGTSAASNEQMYLRYLRNTKYTKPENADGSVPAPHKS